MNSRTTKTLMTLASIALLAACSNTPKNLNSSSQALPQASSQTSVTKVTPVMVPAHLDPNSFISKYKSIYFDFDSYIVKKEFQLVAEQHGKYLAANTQISVRIEGNTDERGSREYNLALGQKRAEALVKALKIYGAKDSQMEAVSWGREKPMNSEHNEKGWAQNRRDDISYNSK